MDCQPLFLLMFFGVGGLFFVIGISLLVKTLRFVRSATAVPGKVVENEKRVGTDTKGRKIDYYYPVMEFFDAHGVLRRITGDTGSNPASFAVGTAVTVLQDPKDPGTACIRSFGELWLMPLMLSVLGGAGLAVAIYVYISASPVHCG